ncbi:putative leucine-rich repeat receptor-like serine/threonine-protein kinase At3g53590 isoform X2 [Punica granatum]|uniref:Leucine-rich repeat receptor-like serine/threonine-protein kinase At3g53590 isoform X2 n=1 Tax=Punica granatum TaxID=22663 RepID=A0A6P8CE20_PUNGR|nr:putative leucine-rich repeat receptor-like serine/threonine-protein kinase At3g53590 isoform X2 [Punica granatum]
MKLNLFKTHTQRNEKISYFISNLKDLSVLEELWHRRLGTSPILSPWIGELKELEVLDLGYNNFSGPLPYKLGNNLSLSILLLDNNVLLTALSPEVYEFKIISEAQVDESLLSASLERNADSIQGQHFIHERMLAGTSPESSNSPDTRNRVRPTAATSFPIPVPFCIPDCIPSPALIPSGLSSGL